MELRKNTIARQSVNTKIHMARGMVAALRARPFLRVCFPLPVRLPTSQPHTKPMPTLPSMVTIIVIGTQMLLNIPANSNGSFPLRPVQIVYTESIYQARRRAFSTKEGFAANDRFGILQTP
jgi:hypothetical protein